VLQSETATVLRRLRAARLLRGGCAPRCASQEVVRGPPSSSRCGGARTGAT